MLIQIQNQACFLKCLFVVAENGEEHVAAVNGVAITYWTCWNSDGLSLFTTDKIISFLNSSFVFILFQGQIVT